ncbi:MAG: efflux RND transporter permease subunit [Bacteroides sp.]|jgi:predicted RND superfamily exporter protein|nr:efflux RND transporter permease subunit [Bacteroides sp.]
MEKLAAFIIRSKFVIIVVVITITIYLGFFIKDLKINSDILGYLPEDDPTATLFKEVGEQYGGNDLIIVGIEGQDIFTYAMLDLVRQVTDSMRSIAGISYVTSLTNVIDIRSSEFGIEIGRLVDEYAIPGEVETLERLRAYALSKDLYKGNLVSADCTSTLVIGKVMTGANRTEAVESIRQKLEGISFEGRFYFGGMPVTLLELSNVIISDIKFIAPVAFLLICLVLFAGFRTVHGIILPMLSVVIAIIWTMGLVSLLGFEITMLTNVVPVILMAVGSAYAIHVVNRFQEELQHDPSEALKRAQAFIIVPVFLASLTTVFGFVSFIAGSYLTMIKEFGIFTALGILFSFLLAVFFIPSVLAAMKVKGTPKTRQKQGGMFLKTITLGIENQVLNHKHRVLWIWGILILFSLWGITRIERRVDLVDYFQENNIVKQSEMLLKSKFNGSMPLYVNIRGDIQSPEALRLMKETQAFMDGYSYIPFSQSVADMIEEMNEVMGEGKRIPDERAKIEQLWFLLDGQEIMEQFVNFDLTEGLIQGYVATTDLEVLREIEQNFGSFAESQSGKGFNVKVTGIPIIFKKLDDSIIKSQIYSLILAMILVVALVSILQRSFFRGILTVIPVFVTLLVLFGTMGLTGIPLDIATVLSGSVTIGIGIDYAIHFMSHFGKSFLGGQGICESIANSIEISGRAIILNMLAVTIGFGVLLFSKLVPLQRFGLLLAVTMIVSAMAALTLLPVALMLTGERLKKIYGVREQLRKRLNIYKK